MAIELKAAKKLAARFGGMPMMPTEANQILQRAEALARYSRSEGHAQRVVQAIVEREAYFPTVSVIVQECEQSPDDEAVVNQRKNCQHCHGDGWRIIDGKDGVSAAVKCHHAANK